ncbi:three component ABC system middle component [Amycolatopsis japonica]|uniref:three component ABC system middle component n=1 Tax=Amycolatopsis japonica TaxID=208439 RepID=UPI00380D6E53
MSWSERSRTQAAMLNPAFLASLTASAALRYQETSGRTMPWVFSFIVAPLVLHRDTRESLPRTIRANLSTWVADHPIEHAGFAQRAVSLRESVQEGLRFGLRNGVLSVTDDGGLAGYLATGKGHTLTKDSDAQQVVARAGFVGRWMSKIDQPATVFTTLGVAP